MRSIAALSGLLALSAAASAAVIPFDPDGPGPAPVVPAASFDFLPGNILIMAGTNQAGGVVPNFYYQARLGAVLDAAGQVIPTPGLNTNYEITVAFGFGTNGAPLGPTAASLSGVVGANAYFSLYFDNVANASDLAGTGFRDGLRILSANPTDANGIFASFGAGLPLDSFGINNYPGVTTSYLTGGLKVTADALAAHPAFFPAGPTFSLVTDTTLANPYLHTDPSANFDIGPDGLIVPQVAAIGPVNGSGLMSVLESDASTGFLVVPEPTSLSLLGLGALALTARRRTSR